MNEKPNQPKTPEIPSPTKLPEVKPEQEPSQPAWPKQVPEIKPELEPSSPTAPNEIPNLPE